MNSNSNEIARFRKLDCCSELYICCLSIVLTHDLSWQLEEFILLHYAHACNTTLSACTTHLRSHRGYHAYTTTPLPYTKSGIFPPYTHKWSLFGRITAEVCLLALRQPARKLLTAVRRLLALESGTYL